jgi:hypothetical protein
VLFENVFSLPEKGPITKFMAPAMALFLFSLGLGNQQHRWMNNVGFGRKVMNDVVAL